MYIGEICLSAMLKTVSIAGIEEQGVPFKKESIELEEAARTVSIGNLTWIECVVDDIVIESPKILAKLGITMDTSTLLSVILQSMKMLEIHLESWFHSYLQVRIEPKHHHV